MSSVEYKEEYRRLLGEIHNLVGEVIKRTKKSDEKAKENDVPWFERHRLHVLIDTARLALKSKNNEVFTPWFFVELKFIVDLLKRWKKTDIWKLIESDLISITSFLHTIGLLTLHDILLANGNDVKIATTGKNPSPDLLLKAKGGTEESVSVEIYHPQKFSGEPNPLSIEDLSKILKKAMKKAKRQLSEAHPGIIAIVGHNQHPANFFKLKEIMAGRLDETNRPYLAGIIFLDIGVTAIKRTAGTSFSRTAGLSYLRNPSYFGSVGVITEGTEETSPNIPIVEKATGINTEEVIGKTISELDFGSISEEIHIERKIKTTKLEHVDEPNPNIDTIIKSEKEIALFLGDSNQNYVCMNCSMILAEKVWPYSLIDMVLKCPRCKRFSKVPQVRANLPHLPYIKTIGIAAGEYDFSDSVRLRRNTSMFGRVPKPTRTQEI